MSFLTLETQSMKFVEILTIHASLVQNDSVELRIGYKETFELEEF